jgi:hypothetical protein
MTSGAVPAGPVSDRLERPVFIVSTPRSGSTLLFETLAQAPGLFSPSGESHRRIEQVSDFFPGQRGWSSNRLEASDATPAAVEALAQSFYPHLRDRDGRPATARAIMLEKTPKNALRVPFFASAWPESRFVYLYRDPRPTLASMIEAWMSGRFATYRTLPGWDRPYWSLLLIPGWRELIGRTLPEIVARQWATTTELLVDDLSSLDPCRVVALEHDAFLGDPQAAMVRLTGALGLEWDRQLPPALPYSKTTFSRPSPDKWRRFESEIEGVWPLIVSADAKARAFLDRSRG